MNADHRVCIALLFVVVVGLMSLKGGMHESFFDYDYGPVAALQTDVSNVKGTVSALSLVVARNTRDLQVARQFTTPAAPAVAVAAAVGGKTGRAKEGKVGGRGGRLSLKY